MISINSLSGYLIGSKFCEPTRIRRVRSPDWTLFCFLQGRFGEGRDAPALLLQQGEQPVLAVKMQGPYCIFPRMAIAQ